jgi:DNA-binding LacI/PurR family transcriptional regulator
VHSVSGAPTSLDVSGGAPLYQQLRQQLISRIRRGEFGPGDMLPSENQLCEEYSVSVTTARRALLELVKEGVVRRRIGVGTMVASRVRQVHLGFVSIDNLGGAWRGISAGMVELIGGIGELAWRRNASFSMSGVDEDGAAETLRSVAEARSVDGVLLRTANALQAEHLDILDAAGMPYVVIKRELPGRLLNCVVTDDLQGARLATAHLLEQGHTRIGFVCGKPSLTLSQDRLRGYREALAAAGVADDPELVRLEPSFGEQSGRRAARDLLEQPDRPTAVFVASDTMAIGAYGAVSSLGLRLPRDVALVGYDDIGTAALLQPPLTTVRTGYHDFGRLAAQLLLDVIEGRLDPPQRIVIKPELIVRGSTGAAPSDVRPLARSVAAAPTGELAAKRVRVSGTQAPAELLAAALAAGGAELVPAAGGAEAGPLDGAVHVVDLRRELEAGLGPAQAEADEMARALGRRGSLVLVALLPAAERSLHAAAAAGVEQVVRAVAASWSGRGVRANAVLAGAADLEGAAGSCRFLLSDAAAALTGQVFRTTGADSG